MSKTNKRNQNNKKTSDKVIAAVCVVFALLIAAVLVLNVLGEAGVFIRHQNVAERGDVVVDAAMLSFFYNDHLLNWYNQYYAYMGYCSIDLSGDLRTQQFGGGIDTYLFGQYEGTWYDYFLDSVKDEINMYVTYAVAAKAAGLSISDEDKAEIDGIIKDLKESLKEAGASFSDWYGKGVKEKDVRRCYELIYLASKFNDHKLAELESALEADDEPVYTFREENKGDFYTAKYLSYKISLSSKNFAKDELYDNAVAAAKAAAEKIAEAKTPAQFVELVEEYEASKKTETETKKETETGTGTETETLSPEEELESKIEKLEGSINYETDDELGKWIFEESASVNDSKVIEETGTETVKVTEKETEEETESGSESGTESKSDSKKETTKTYDTYKVTVYLLTQTPSLDMSLTKDMAFLVTDSKDIATAFAESFKSGEMTRDRFEELASAKYDELFANHEHSEEEDHVDPVFSYDNVEKAQDNYFAAAYDKINQWLDTGKLEKNTLSDVIEIKIEGKTDAEDQTYYALVFFESYNVKAWYANAYDGVLNKQFEDWYEAELKNNPVVYDEEALYDINTLKMYPTSSDGHDH